MKKLILIPMLAFALGATAQTTILGPTKILGPTTIPLSGTASPSLVLSCGNALSGAQTSITCQMKNSGGTNTNISTGNQLYICVTDATGNPTIWSGDTGAFTVDPGAGTPVTSFSWAGAGSFTSCVFKNSATGGGSVITATGTYSYPSIVGISITNGIFDKSDNGVGGVATTTPTSGNITPSLNGSLLVGIISGLNGPTITAGTNVAWVVTPFGTNTSTTSSETVVQATAASVNAQATLSASQFSFAHIVDFKP